MEEGRRPEVGDVPPLLSVPVPAPMSSGLPAPAPGQEEPHALLELEDIAVTQSILLAIFVEVVRCILLRGVIKSLSLLPVCSHGGERCLMNGTPS